jgi:histidinol-phosphate/aromatic aminotransferase/cobyric acid decarboxylase-like protein/GNAT superfamily N-acetyltransferase
MHTLSTRTRIRIANANLDEREAIYRLRHDVYAADLGQHPTNAQRRLTDTLDTFNHYVVATCEDEVAGFVSVTPPGHGRYSIDKYLDRSELPFPVDDRLYEVRLLTVASSHRGRPIAGLLMLAALRWIESRGGTRIVAIGRREVLGMYRKVGLEPLGRQITCGAVSFELMTATPQALRRRLARFAETLRKVESGVDWQLDVPLHALTKPAPDSPEASRGHSQRTSSRGRVSATCFHGGAFWKSIGDEFVTLERHRSIVNADVLDAWFPPSPRVIQAIQDHLPFLIGTSPPTGCEGMIRAIARARGVQPTCVLPGAGSSSLIFRALRHWLKPSSRVLILDPMYGEYAHVLEEVIKCHVDRLILSRDNDYQVDVSQLDSRMARGYDLVVLVNPNSPTGRHVPRRELEKVLRRVPGRTRVWIDETYIEYAGAIESMEEFAANSSNVVVCKSMSKVYALSGVRAAYLCAAPRIIDDLRPISPPWAVSLLGQVAAVAALADPEYYAARYAQTHVLREEFRAALLSRTPIEVVPSVASFMMCHLPVDGPDAATVCRRCREDGVFIRDVSNMGSQIGRHALRVAVKDRDANEKVVNCLEQVGGQYLSDIQS